MATGRIVSVTVSDYACQAGDWRIYVNPADPGPTTITLPVDPTASMVILVKDAKGDASLNNITVLAPSIDGADHFVLDEDWQCQEFGWNGSGWSVQ